MEEQQQNLNHMSINRLTAKERRKIRVRAKITGTSSRPRLCVQRTNKYIYAQLIDDEKRVTLLSASEKDIKDTKDKKTKTEKAKIVGQLLAEYALKKKIKSIVFDRGSYLYHGRVRALAEGARAGGLIF